MKKWNKHLLYILFVMSIFSFLSPLSAEAKVRKGLVIIECSHKASFYVNNKSSGLSPSKKAKLKLEPGHKKIRIEYLSYETQTINVEVVAGKRMNFIIHLPKKGLKRDKTAVVEAGTFIMGISPKSIKTLIKKFGGKEKEFLNATPKRVVKLEKFEMDKFEVTNEMYKKFVNKTKHRTPAGWKNNMYPKGEKYFPVVNVSYNDALAYAKWAGKRLPTEEEWEKAARGANPKSGRIFPWGIKFKIYCANTKENGHNKPYKTGEYEKGVSPYGIYDMSGNIAEWTSSSYKPYPGSKDVPHKKSNYKTIRGGAFDSPVYASIISFRDKMAADAVSPRVGFRCVK